MRITMIIPNLLRYDGYAAHIICAFTALSAQANPHEDFLAMPDSVTSAATPDDLDDIEPLAKLHAEMDACKAAYVFLWAHYGPGGVWDHERKALLARLAQRARQELLEKGTKFTEAMIDEAARASEAYRVFLVTARENREDFERLDITLEQIRHRIRRGDSIQYLASRSARLPQ